MEICHECGAKEEHFNLRKCLAHLTERAEAAEAQVAELVKDKEKLESKLMKANGRLFMVGKDIVRVSK